MSDSPSSKQEPYDVVCASLARALGDLGRMQQRVADLELVLAATKDERDRWYGKAIRRVEHGAADEPPDGCAECGVTKDQHDNPDEFVPRLAHPPTVVPVAWRKPVEPQYDYTDRYRYREEHGIGAPEGWEPLYTASPMSAVTKRECELCGGDKVTYPADSFEGKPCPKCCPVEKPVAHSKSRQKRLETMTGGPVELCTDETSERTSGPLCTRCKGFGHAWFDCPERSPPSEDVSQ